ncbi:damage-inducible protein CinA [Alkalilimnicola ehrlichii]|uniref:Damage-inducible protein CinA n=1 Tax=Alkalilimnicola ehrlichii TaxID=351052 RepID=A0A3E0WKF7_9GAMM|nr:nicotinamide-nucleotide amidase [Alkalilimnicola ehrlichii]RFA26379.1 damage-inducible protein CinA [Alkalilimnicola ehrlichii]RFA33442.1 damage-inducible protein CinA [Alkalilimnicola ehrlichii]
MPNNVDATLEELAQAVGGELKRRGWRLTAAESCTGGWIAKLVTDVPGSSEWFGYGYVTYSNEAKQALLGVQAETLAVQGAVSDSVVREMALGALRNSGADISVAVSGVAGPGGGSEHKPVGTVWFAWAWGGQEVVARRLFEGDRKAVRQQAAECALRGILQALSGEGPAMNADLL